VRHAYAGMTHKKETQTARALLHQYRPAGRRDALRVALCAHLPQFERVGARLGEQNLGSGPSVRHEVRQGNDHVVDKDLGVSEVLLVVTDFKAKEDCLARNYLFGQENFDFRLFVGGQNGHFVELGFVRRYERKSNLLILGLHNDESGAEEFRLWDFRQGREDDGLFWSVILKGRPSRVIKVPDLYPASFSPFCPKYVGERYSSVQKFADGQIFK
jgi:hypothetical protein